MMESQQKNLNDALDQENKAEQEARFKLHYNTVTLDLGAGRGLVEMRDLGDRVEIYWNFREAWVIQPQAANMIQISPLRSLLKQ